VLALALTGYAGLATLVAPISARAFYDPAVQYMLASLSVFRGAGYRYIDHPGTPVEVLGTVILAVTYPFVASAPQGFVGYHLAHPEQFMALMQGLLLVASVGTCLFFVQRALPVVHWTQALAAVGLGGAFFGLHSEAFQTLAIWSHTSFCFIGGTTLSLLVLLTVRQPRKPRWTEVVALGFASGVLTSVQLYFAAFVLGTAVALTVGMRLHGLELRYALRRGEWVIAMAAVGFVVATLPIHDQYLRFANWVWRLSDHQGIYGEGQSGFSTPTLLASNLINLLMQAPLLSGITLVALVLMAVRIVRPGAARPQRYLLPIAATLPVLYTVLLESLNPWSIAAQRFAAMVGAAGLVLFSVGLGTAIGAHIELAKTLQRGDVAIRAVLDQIAVDQGLPGDNLRILWTYGSTSQCYVLWFSDYSTDHVLQSDIARLCPRDSNLDIWKAEVFSSDGVDLLRNFTNWDVAVVADKLAEQYPDGVPQGRVYSSDIPSPPYGNLQFIVNQAT
jgi:hypothetical protein